MPLQGILNIRSLTQKISKLSGWRRNALAFALGVCATFTLAPFFIFPLIIPAFTGLYLLINAAPDRKRVFWDGWWWGWGFYITGLYWFCIALLTDAEHFAWLIPFALFGLTGVIAIYSGLACLIASLLFPSLLQGERETVKICIFSVIWTCIEYARGHLFTGFPWNLAGYSFGFSDASLQLASLVGVYGLTLFAVLLGTSFAAHDYPPPPRLWAAAGRGGGLSTHSEQLASSSLTLPRYAGEGIIFIIIVWGLFAFGVGWGAWRLHEADQVPQNERYVPDVMLRLVQANISQPHKWDPELQLKGVREQVRLTRSPGLDKVTHVIWPETAVPHAIEKGSPLVHELGASVPEGKILITGALRAEGEEHHFQIWNSLVAIDHQGDIVGSYDKSKLVPFGEFLPFRRFIPKAWLTPVGDTDFSRGQGAQTLEWTGLPPISPLICYEVIFPESAVDTTRRPQLLLNVTNDAWFGMSTGPYQHFEMSRMRAAEQGIPLVRVANTGISAVIDSYGRVVAVLPLGTKAILDSKLPKTQKTYTTYSICSRIIILSLLFTVLALIINQGRGQK